jgi:purine-nucleoside phosphorylase
VPILILSFQSLFIAWCFFARQIPLPLALAAQERQITTLFKLETPMTVHIGAKPGEIAETVLMPGDPYRAKWAAETFLEGAVLVNEVRGMLGFTGMWNGNRVTIQGSGMGMPSLSIYANELIRDYDAKTLIRIGSCGGMQPQVGIRDVIIAMTASTITSPSSGIFKEVNYAPTADWSLLRAAVAASESKGCKTHVGGIYSSDVFYAERPDLDEQMVRHGILGVEMEAAELYTLAARHGRRALAVLTVSDHLQTGEALPSEDREKTFGDMVEIALEAAFA